MARPPQWKREHTDQSNPQIQVTLTLGYTSEASPHMPRLTPVDGAQVPHRGIKRHVCYMPFRGYPRFLHVRPHRPLPETRA